MRTPRSRQPREAKPKRTFADIDAARPRYNPDVEGYGNEREWRGSFYERLGWEKAWLILQQQKRTPRQILGVGAAAPWDEIKAAFRKLAMDYHPDRIKNTGLSEADATTAFQDIRAAYEVLEHEFRK